ncbi:DUF6019 family protein [Clostridium sp.]
MGAELGVNSGIGLIILIPLYYLIKCTVKNGINELVLNFSDKSNTH